MEILEIPIGLEQRDFEAKFRIRDPQERERFSALLETAQCLIEGKACYAVAYVDEKLENGVIVNQTFLRSRVLRKNLDGVHRIFPYVVTIGSRLEEKASTCDDLLEQYYLDAIGNAALRKGRKYLEDHLRSKFSLGGLSFMSPGSLADWPIEEQKPLFSILEGVETAIGVKLNESLLMIPRKSVSGIFFPTKITFYSCQLCPREHCEGRKAPYHKAMAEEYGLVN